MLVNKAFLIRIREGKELKAPRYASAAATRNGNLPLRDGSLPYLTATYLIPDKYFFFFFFFFFYIHCIILRTILRMQPLGYGAIVLYT
jgi:hypothetical protein